MEVTKNIYSMLINGEKVTTEQQLHVINPATEEVFAYVPVATKEHLNSAVDAARNALPSWSAKSLEERGKLISNFAEKISEKKEELAQLLTMEQGKPLNFARAELDMAVHWCREIAKYNLKSEVIEETDQYIVEKTYSPVGVVAAIVPWNFPILLTMFKVPAALLAGNTIIVKPSPYTPLGTLLLGELAQEFFPPGVFNVLSGDDHLGPWITEHPNIDKVSFTGSSATGKKVMQSAAENLKRVTLELGGNDAAIVLPDVNPKEVAPKLFWAGFMNSGQVCINAKRFYIHKDIYDDVLNELVTIAKTIKVGNGLDSDSLLGPIQNKAQYEKVKKLIEDAQKEGVHFALGGEVEVENEAGYFIPITIADNPPENSRIVTEEPFGPVIPLLKYEDYDDVIERANNSVYGLGSSVWGTDIELAKTIAQRLQAGTTWINECAVLSPTVPFGGHKQSGLGFENGLDGLKEYTLCKIIRINKG